MHFPDTGPGENVKGVEISGRKNNWQELQYIKDNAH